MVLFLPYQAPENTPEFFVFKLNLILKCIILKTFLRRNLTFVTWLIKIDDYELQIFNRVPDGFCIGIFAES